MTNVMKRLAVALLVGMVFFSGSAKSLLIKSAHADTCSQGEDDGEDGESQSGGSCN